MQKRRTDKGSPLLFSPDRAKGGRCPQGSKGVCACAARAHKRGETQFSPLLRITPFSF